LVKLYANLRKLAGKKEVSIAGSSLRAVLNELVRQNPSLEDIIFENERLRPHIVITVSGHNATDVDAPLTEQDVVALFPPIAGG
jgi:MoaD family protein